MSSEKVYKHCLIGIQIYKIIVFALYLAYYAKRIHKLDRLASNSNTVKSKSLKFRVTLISLLILLQVLHIILSFADPNYWLFNYSTFSLVECLCIIDLFLQIYIITREHKKKSHRSRSLIMLWLLMIAGSLSTVVIVEHFSPNPGVAISIVEIAILMVLVIITFISTPDPPEEQDIESLRQSFRKTSLLPLMGEARPLEEKKKIYIEFNKQFQIKMKGVIPQCIFKIAVYVGGQSHIITKSEKDFIELSKKMTEKFPQSDVVFLKPHSITANNVLRYGEEMQKINETYLVEVTSNSEFYVEPLMDFLQISSQLRIVLQNRSKLFKKDTMNSEDELKLRQPFFKVSWKDDKISVSNAQLVTFIVNKTPLEIVQFHHKLSHERKLKVDYLSDDPDMQEMIHFIDSVANSKNLWRNFAEWMCLGSSLEDKIYNFFDYWNHGFKHMDMSIIGHEISFDKEGTIIFYYLLSIRKKCAQGEATTLKKRFNDFVKLDKGVRKFVEQVHLKNAHLPSLPPKFSPFGNKTSPKARQIYFDSYIKELINIEGINHCLKLLEFLQIDNTSLASEFYRFEVDPDRDEEMIESVKLEELELSKIQ